MLSGSRVYIFYGLRRGGVITKKPTSRRMRDDGGVVPVRESACVQDAGVETVASLTKMNGGGGVNRAAVFVDGATIRGLEPSTNGDEQCGASSCQCRLLRGCAGCAALGTASVRNRGGALLEVSFQAVAGFVAHICGDVKW